MSYCLNPVCTQPQNPDIDHCKSCGAKLLLGDHYRALSQIGQGGFGKTFLAVNQDLSGEPPCVVKQFSQQIQGAGGLAKAKKLFYAEAKQLNILGKHPQIPELLAYFEQDGQLYLVQEYVEGHTNRQNLAEELAEDVTFSEAKIRELLAGLLPVLQHIHDNKMIHRDIKPENIIRRKDGTLFLVDFGLIKLVTGSTLLKTGVSVVGTVGYAAPEQLNGKADFNSDLYSLGVTCLHLLTGMEPHILFDNGEHKWVWRDYLLNPNSISESLGNLLDKMVEMGVNRRYKSASDVLKALNGQNNIVQIPTVSQVPTQINVQVKQVPQISKSIAPVKSVPSLVSTSTVSTPTVSTVSLKPIQIGDKWEYQDESGKVFSKVPFEAASEFSEGFAAVCYKDKWGFIDGTGEIVIEPQFDMAYNFYSGLARIITEQGEQGSEYKYHFINTTGQIAFSLEYNRVGDFVGEIAPVGISDSNLVYGYGGRRINTDIWSKQQDSWGVSRWSPEEKKDVYWSEGKYGFIYTNGDLVTDLKFDWISPFLNGYAIVRIDNKYDLVDLRGKTVLNDWQRVSSYENFNRRYDKDLVLLLCDNNKYCLISRDKGLIQSYKYRYSNEQCNGFDYIDYFHYEKQFSENYPVALFKIDDKWGLINRDLEVVVKPEYDQIELYLSLSGIDNSISFDNKIKHLDLALVSIEDKVGLINTKSGNTLIKPQSKLNNKSGYGSDFCLGLPAYSSNLNDTYIQEGLFYRVRFAGKWGLINGDCDRIIINPKYDYMGKYYDGVSVVRLDEKYGLINEDGEEIINPFRNNDRYFSYINDFSYGKANATFCREVSNTIEAILFSVVNRTLPYKRENSKWVFYFEETIDLRGNLVKK